MVTLSRRNCRVPSSDKNSRDIAAASVGAGTVGAGGEGCLALGGVEAL